MKHITLTIKKSVQIAFAIIAGLSTIAGLWGYTIRDINSNWSWWIWGLVLLASFLVIASVSYVVLNKQRHKPCKITINGKCIVIKSGDLFTQNGWKVVPFNDRFDTQVDDVIIAHNTLNGKMIDNYVNDLTDLQHTISSASSDSSVLKPIIGNGRSTYPLGRIIPYKDFLMLSFSHFDDQNTAFIDLGEYEQMLIRMWSELRRVYAGRPIFIPLIGAGITTINGVSEKNYTEILKCILCTLKNSKFQPDQGIGIILTEEAMGQIDMNIIKEEF